MFKFIFKKKNSHIRKFQMPNMVWIGEPAAKIISCPANEISNVKFPPKSADNVDEKVQEKVKSLFCILCCWSLLSVSGSASGVLILSYGKAI